MRSESSKNDQFVVVTKAKVSSLGSGEVDV